MFCLSDRQSLDRNEYLNQLEKTFSELQISNFRCETNLLIKNISIHPHSYLINYCFELFMYTFYNLVTYVSKLPT